MDYLKNKSQISIFMIIASLLLIGSVIAIYAVIQKIQEYEPEIEKTALHDSSAQNLKKYVEDCIVTVAKEGILILSANGGYLSVIGDENYDEPGNDEAFFNYYYYGNARIPYALDENDIKLRPKEEIEKMLSNYIKAELGSCLNDLAPFKIPGTAIEYPEISLPGDESEVSVLIGQDDVSVYLDWPVIISKKDSKNKLDRFHGLVNLRFGLLYSIAQQIIEEANEKHLNSESFNIPQYCEEYIPEDNLVNVYIESNLQTFQYLIRIIDSKPLLDEELPLRFRFAVKNRKLYGECVG